jgi:hypothetical protein
MTVFARFGSAVAGPHQIAASVLVGAITPVRVPEPEEEAARDLRQPLGVPPVGLDRLPRGSATAPRQRS